MAKNMNVHLSLDPELKDDATELFATLGMTLENAVSIFLSVSLLEGGLPFEVKLPKMDMDSLSKAFQSLYGDSFANPLEFFGDDDDDDDDDDDEEGGFDLPF